MSEHIDGGGPAFSGMTLRDYFAIHASDDDIMELMPTTVGDGMDFKKEHGFKATRAWARYVCADAMLAARKESVK